MHYTIVGLGNTGEEYERTRHNVGRIVLEAFRKKEKFSEWEENKKKTALISEGIISKQSVTLMLPELLMNRSGKVVGEVITSVKKAQTLVVVYDDLDLGLGTFKISFGRGSGGHRGVESIITQIKTKDFIRVRVGISPMTPKGKVKKPLGEKKVLDFILKAFNKKEQETLTKTSKQLIAVLTSIVTEGKERTMNQYN